MHGKRDREERGERGREHLLDIRACAAYWSWVGICNENLLGLDLCILMVVSFELCIFGPTFTHLVKLRTVSHRVTLKSKKNRRLLHPGRGLEKLTIFGERLPG